MNEGRTEKGPAAELAAGPETNRTPILWAAAIAVAAFGTGVLFDALPGINWVLWTGAAAAGLAAIVRHRGTATKAVMASGAAATVIAGAAAVNASPLNALICLSVVVLLAMQMLLAVAPSQRGITARFVVTAPVMAFLKAGEHAIRRGVEATDHIRSTRARAWVRGLAITLPVVVVFALLLAEADPIFASWRDGIARLFASRDLLPRAVFFIALLGIVLGAYGYVSAAPQHEPSPGDAPRRWLGSTERLVLLGAVAALLWLFLALQLGYLFGTLLPRAPSSGMTFAEYARRGFGELTVVASATAVLIILSERFGHRGGHEHALRVFAFALITAVLLLLGSALHRLRLYEAAYGFTTARLYAKTYMTLVAVGLFLLATEVARELDAGRLFRRTAAVAIVLFVALLYWNHEAWIARRNIERFADTGKLDVRYLTHELSLNAVPAIVERLPSLPEPTRSELRGAVQSRYAGRREPAEGRWYEWNLARTRARAALATTSGASPD